MNNSVIKTVYLDCDGVICDFVKKCKEYNAIKGTKVDWKIIISLGSEFWEELDWTQHGKEFYLWLEKLCRENNIELCILSAITRTKSIEGRNKWLDKHTNISHKRRHYVNKGNDKGKYASEDAVLIDDCGVNIEAFMSAGGKGIKFENVKDTQDKLISMIIKG